jgi:hypothetical protein
MSGRFKAAGTLPLASVGLFAIHGEIVDGIARIGQTAMTDTGFRARVHGVEFVRLADGREDVALTFLPRDNAEAERWHRLPLAGQELELVERVYP